MMLAVKFRTPLTNLLVTKRDITALYKTTSAKGGLIVSDKQTGEFKFFATMVFVERGTK